MGRHKSIEAKRKQRKRQKKRKTKNVKAEVKAKMRQEDLDALVHSQAVDTESFARGDAQQCIALHSGVCEPKLPADHSIYSTGVVSYGGIREEDREKLRFIQTLPLKEQAIELWELFYDRTEAAMYFRDKCIRKEEEIEIMRLEFDDRVKQVRHFRYDQIFKEHSRPGKLLKYSMQNK